MVRVFRDDHVRQRRLGRKPALDQRGRSRSLDHADALAFVAAVARADRLDDHALRRNEVRPLAAGLADPCHLAAVAGQSVLSGSITSVRRSKWSGKRSLERAERFRRRQVMHLHYFYRRRPSPADHGGDAILAALLVPGRWPARLYGRPKRRVVHRHMRHGRKRRGHSDWRAAPL